jgi:hypothetical protein
VWRQLGPQDVDDRVHGIIVIVVDAISNGEVREPERLMGFVATVAKRMIAAQIHADSFPPSAPRALIS